MKSINVYVPRLAGGILAGSALLLLFVVMLLAGGAYDPVAIVERANGIAYFGAAILGLAIAWQTRATLSRRVFWFCATAGFALLGCAEIFGSMSDRVQTAWAESDYDDLVLWLLTPIGIYFACSMERAPRLSLLLMALGFALQSISNLIDLFEIDLIHSLGWNEGFVETLTSLSELFFIQTYLLGLASIILFTFADRRRVLIEAVLRAREPAAQIHGAYRFRVYNKLAKGRIPSSPLIFAYLRCAPLLRLIPMLRWTGVHGRAIADLTGKSPRQQMREQQALIRAHRLPPRLYYLFELYLPEHAARAGEYLQRHETKASVYKLLRQPRRGSMTDKLAFAKACAKHGVRAAPVLLAIDEGKVRDPKDVTRLPDIDLFVKPRYGKGGRGAERWTLRGLGRYESGDGLVLSSDELLRWLVSRSKRGGVLVQPNLRNHPDLRDLSVGALSTLRILSCLNEQGEPEITHAAMRMSRGRDSIVDNFHSGGIAAAVDIASGRLGPASDLAIKPGTGWLTHHPDTGAEIAGREVPLWRETLDLVQRAHQANAAWYVVGWDVAVLEDGPILIEGNGSPDLDILQRCYRAPIGSSRFGQAMAHYLRRRVARYKP